MERINPKLGRYQKSALKKADFEKNDISYSIAIAKSTYVV